MEQLSRETVWRILDDAPVARLGQIDSRDGVQAIPFVFARVNDRLFSPVDGKPKRHAKLARLTWLDKYPNVTVLIDNYEADWSQLWWLRLYGVGTSVGEEHPDWPQCVNELQRKYPQYEQIPMFQHEPTMMCITIERWTAWAFSPGGIS